jgi:hypothetical protein
MTNEDNVNIIDLDSVAPPKAIVKFDGKSIELKSPELGKLLEISTLATPLQKANEIAAEQVIDILDRITDKIYEMVPELSGSKLSIQQSLVLVKALQEMAIPQDAKELAAKGIKLDSDPKAVSA